MNNKRVLAIILALALLVGAIILTYFILQYYQKEKPVSRAEKVRLLEKKAAEVKAVKKEVVVQAIEQKAPETTVLFTEIPELAPEAKALLAQAKEKKILLVSNPGTIKIKIPEGKQGEAGLEILNASAKEIALNIYKTAPQVSLDEAKQRLRELLENKRNALSSLQNVTLEKTANFSGASWLMPFPYNLTLKPDTGGRVKVTVDANMLEAGINTAYLVFAGANEAETLLVPVEVEVIASPKIKVTGVNIDDGLSENTKGNANHVADAAETVLLTVYLKNEGSGFAKDLSAEFSSNGQYVTVQGENKAFIPYLDAGGEYALSFLLTVSDSLTGPTPSSAVLTTTDPAGESWTDSFYLGEPGNIKYPLGARIKKEYIKDIPEESEVSE